MGVHGSFTKCPGITSFGSQFKITTHNRRLKNDLNPKDASQGKIAFFFFFFFVDI